MFILLFRNKIKILLRNKAMLFWTLIFPFILATFFQIALSNVGESFEMESFPIAVVQNKNYEKNETLKLVIENLSKEGENQIFKTYYISETEAETNLKESKIEGYIIVDEKNNPQIVIKSNGLNQTIMKSVLDEYNQLTKVAEESIKFNSQILYNGVIENLYKQEDFMKDVSNEKIDFSINYFFTLIAMTCLYGSLIGLEVIKDCEANLSKKGARMCISPVNKLKMILARHFSRICNSNYSNSCIICIFNFCI